MVLPAGKAPLPCVRLKRMVAAGANINGVVYPVFYLAVLRCVIGKIRHSAVNAAASHKALVRKVKAKILFHALLDGMGAYPEFVTFVFGIYYQQKAAVPFILMLLLLKTCFISPPKRPPPFPLSVPIHFVGSAPSEKS